MGVQNRQALSASRVSYRTGVKLRPGASKFAKSLNTRSDIKRRMRPALYNECAKLEIAILPFPAVMNLHTSTDALTFERCE